MGRSGGSGGPGRVQLLGVRVGQVDGGCSRTGWAMLTLRYPLPVGARIVRRTNETMTIVMTLPAEVADLLSIALELAGRLTQSDKLGAQLAAVCQEVTGEWGRQAIEQRREALSGMVLGEREGR